MLALTLAGTFGLAYVIAHPTVTTVKGHVP